MIRFLSIYETDDARDIFSFVNSCDGEKIYTHHIVELNLPLTKIMDKYKLHFCIDEDFCFYPSGDDEYDVKAKIAYMFTYDILVTSEKYFLGYL